MNRNTRARLLTPVVLAIGLVYCAACGGGEDATPESDPADDAPTTAEGASPTLLTARCDTQGYFRLVADLVDADEDDPRLDLFSEDPGRLSRSETHDCQRLITSDELVYGPWVALLAAAGLSAPVPPEGRVVAVIINYTGESYPALGIHGEGKYCVYMRARSSGTGWEDTQVFAAPDGTCRGADPSQATDPITSLSTTSRVVAGNRTPLDYPDAARWMWDEASGSQYIGIRCATGWCQLAPEGLTVPTADFPVPDSVPGWFDRQRLAVVSAAGPEVSDLLGTIKPRAGVQFDTPAQQRAALEADSMVAAEITLEGTDLAARRTYATKWEIPFDSIRTDPSVHRIWMRVQGDQWVGWIKGQPKRPLQPVSDVRHSGLRTVRWRWLESDEGGWLPCGGACCVWY